MRQSVTINRYDYPDVRAESAALAIMEEAFDPRFGEAWNARQLTGFTGLGGVELSIARIDASQIGFTLTRRILDETELLLLAVRPSWQGKGIGKILVEHCIESARTGGGKSLHLEVRANNPAILFYDALGFEHIHRRPNYYVGHDGEKFDALSYHLDLR